MKVYKVLDLSYSDDPDRHLLEVRAYHEGDGWRLLSVVYAAGRWLYYLERDGEPGPQDVAATAVGSEQGLSAPVRRVEGGTPGEVLTAGADVTAEGVTVEVPGRPPLTLDEFRRLTWEQSERGIVTENPAHVPLIEKFLAAKDDPEKLRAFIEDDLGGEWQEEPYRALAIEEAEELEPAARGVKIELHPYLVGGERPHVSWHVNLLDAGGRKLEGYVPKGLERMLERVRSLARGQDDGGDVAGPS